MPYRQHNGSFLVLSLFLVGAGGAALIPNIPQALRLAQALDKFKADRHGARVHRAPLGGSRGRTGRER